MKEKRKPIKRKGKMPHKKLNMRDAIRKNNDVFPVQNSDSLEVKKPYKPKTTLNQRVNEFRQSGLTLLKGTKDSGKKKINFK